MAGLERWIDALMDGRMDRFNNITFILMKVSIYLWVSSHPSMRSTCSLQVRQSRSPRFFPLHAFLCNVIASTN